MATQEDGEKKAVKVIAKEQLKSTKDKTKVNTFSSLPRTTPTTTTTTMKLTCCFSGVCLVIRRD